MGKGVRHVISYAESVPETDLFRPVSRAGKFLRAIRQGPRLRDRQADALCGCRRTDLLCHGHGLYLVLERGVVPAAIGGYRVPAETLRHTGSVGNRGATNAIQGACVGGSR